MLLSSIRSSFLMRFSLGVACFGFAALTAAHDAMAVGHETLTPNEATQIGMVSQWQMPMAISGGIQGFIDGKIHVDKSRTRSIYEVSYDGKVHLRFPADMADAFGQPVGKQEAERLAKMATYKLKRIG